MGLERIGWERTGGEGSGMEGLSTPPDHKGLEGTEKERQGLYRTGRDRKGFLIRQKGNAMDGRFNSLTSKYPFDYDALKKGDRFGPEVIGPIVDCEPKTYEYSLKVMALVKQIEMELWARGKTYTICVLNHGVAILTDAEASAYNADRFKGHQSGLARANVKMAAVDTGTFTDAERARHDKSIRDQGAILAAIMAAKSRGRAVERGAEERGLAGPDRA
jgi:hypothetical protein